MYCSVSLFQEARDLVKRMLKLDPSKRPTADHILRDKWLQDIASNRDEDLGTEVLKRLNDFAATTRMQKLALLVRGVLFEWLKFFFAVIVISSKIPFTELIQTLLHSSIMATN